MATLLSRIRGLVVARAHHAVDQAENPQLMSHQLVRDLTTELANTNRGLVAAMGAECQLRRSRERMEQEAADWERSAETLLRKGEEGLAREALERAVALRQGFNGGASLFAGAPGLTTELLRVAARQAGAHLYCDTDCNVYANGPFVALHAAQDGPVVLDLGKPGPVVNVMSGEKVGEGPVLKLEMKRGETRVLRVGE